MSSCAAIATSRIPKKLFMTPGDFASALDVGLDKVYGWIEDGSLDALNLNPGGARATYKISRESAERLIQKLTKGTR